MTLDTKLIIASNLTNAAILREGPLKEVEPAILIEEHVMQIFTSFVNQLEIKYPESR